MTAMDNEQLKIFISDPQRVGTLATVDRQGNPNSAVIGSATLHKSGQLAMGLGDNRSLKNLRDNPKAVFTIFQPAQNFFAWQGVRLYLKCEAIDTDGELKQQVVQQVEATAGTFAARMIVAAVRFSIEATRPLLDRNK